MTAENAALQVLAKPGNPASTSCITSHPILRRKPAWASLRGNGRIKARTPGDSPMRRLGEIALIADYLAPLASHPGAFGLKDDAALLTGLPPAGLVITADGLVAG